MESSSVVPYARFLERQAWRAKIANDFRTLDAAAVTMVEVVGADGVTNERVFEAEAVATCER